MVDDGISGNKGWPIALVIASATYVGGMSALEHGPVIGALVGVGMAVFLGAILVWARRQTARRFAGLHDEEVREIREATLDGREVTDARLAPAALEYANERERKARMERSGWQWAPMLLCGIAVVIIGAARLEWPDAVIGALLIAVAAWKWSRGPSEAERHAATTRASAEALLRDPEG